MALLDILKKVKKKASDIVGGAENAIGSAASSVGSTISNIEKGSQQAGARARQQVNRTIQNIPQPIKTIGNIGANLVVPIDAAKQFGETLSKPFTNKYDLQALKSRQDKANADLEYAKLIKIKNPELSRKVLEQTNKDLIDIQKSASNLAKSQPTPLQIGAQAGNLALQTALSSSGLKAAGQGIKAISKSKGFVKPILKSAGIGAAAGGTSTALDLIGRGETDAKQIAKNALIGAGIGGAIGGVAPVAISGATKLIKETPKITTKVSQDIANSLQEPKFQPGFASTKPKVELEPKLPKMETDQIRQSPFERELKESVNKDIQASKTFKFKHNVNDKVKFKFGDGSIKNAIITDYYLENGIPQYTVRVPSSNNKRIKLKEQDVISNKQPKTEAPVVKLATTEPRKPEITVLEAEKVPTLDNYKKIKSEDLYAELNRLDTIPYNNYSEEDIKYSKIEKELSDRADNDALNSTVNNIKQNMEKSGFFDDDEITDSKRVLQKYNRDVTVQEIFTDFASALEGAKSWMPDTLKLKYSLIEANKKNIPIENLIKSYITKFKDYDIDTALDIAERKISEATGKKINIRDFLKTQQQPTQPIVKISQAQTKPTIKLTQPKVEVPVTAIVKIKSEKPKTLKNHYWIKTKSIVDDYISKNPTSRAAVYFQQQAKSGDLDRAYARALSPDAGNIFGLLPKDLQNEWATKKAFDQETGETITLMNNDTLRGTHIFNAKADLDNRLQDFIKKEKPIVSKKADELAKEALQTSVQEPVKPKIAPETRVLPKEDISIKPTVETQPKKVVETSIDPSDPFGNRNRINQIRNELGSLVDTDYKMLKTLRKIEKETGTKGLVDQWDFDTGNIRASRAMANAKIRQSQELSDALSGLNKKQAQNFDEYIKARAELENYTPEMKTSKPREELTRIVAVGDAEFSDRFSSVNQYYKNMAQDMYEGGLIDQNTLNRYLADDNYVRLQRDVEDLVGAMPGKSEARSIRTTTAKQKRTGSERELLSPTQSLLKRTQQIELEIQRNKAANNIIDTLVEYGLAIPVKTSKNKNTIARLVNGKKELFEVNGEIKQIIDNVSPYNLGVLAQIVSTPTRIFRAGTTALSAPFSIINYLRDQASSAIYSKNTLATHNPINIITGLSNAISDQAKGNKSPLWQKFERYIGDQTVYDELRNAANSNRLLREAREGQIGRFKNAILDPIRTIEDINSITEKATRFQNFEGIYKNAIKKGLPEEEAIKEAVLAARRNSVDFNKGSDFSRVVNLFIPYFNASVQGTRNVVQSFAQRPVGTAMKSIGFVALPSVIATAYNLSDETRKEAYNSINEFEKENNFIIIGPDAKQNEQGTWTGIYKIPKPQGYRELTDPVRDVTEAFLQGESVDNVGKMFYDMLGAVSGPFNIQSPEKFLGSIIPQAIKPTIQAGLNKDIFTGKQIVPQYMVEQTQEPSKRAYKSTSGTARIIGEQLGVSPLQVEQFTKGTTGSLGQYTTNLIDQALAKAGIIKQEQVGGKNIIQDITRKLFEASGELPESKKPAGQKYFESVAEVKKDLSAQDQKAWDTLHPVKTNFLGEEVFDENKRLSKYTRAGIYGNNPAVLEADRKLNQLMKEKGNPSNPLFELSEPLLQLVLKKEALPPGSKDPQLSALYKEEWFQDYQKARSDYYEQIKANMAKQGKELPKSTNPYPTTPPELQKAMDYYSSLPKGTGARSTWIKNNPGLWQNMTAQWQKVDAWENKERVAMGLDEIINEASSAAGYGKGGGRTTKSKVKGDLELLKLKSQPKIKIQKLKRTLPSAPTKGIKLSKTKLKNIQANKIKIKGLRRR